MNVMSTCAPPSDSMSVFCTAVKSKLGEMGISQNELARRLELDESYFSKLLRGKAGNCTLETCDKIAAQLHTTTGQLLLRD